MLCQLPGPGFQLEWGPPSHWSGKHFLCSVGHPKEKGMRARPQRMRESRNIRDTFLANPKQTHGETMCWQSLHDDLWCSHTEKCPALGPKPIWRSLCSLATAVQREFQQDLQCSGLEPTVNRDQAQATESSGGRCGIIMLLLMGFNYSTTHANFLYTNMRYSFYHWSEGWIDLPYINFWPLFRVFYLLSQ